MDKPGTNAQSADPADLTDRGLGWPSVSAVIPCLNEAKTIATCVEKARRALGALGVEHEVLVVDNGSTDGSARIAAEAGAVVVHESRRGYGSAYLAGFRAARGEILVMADGDDTYDLSDVVRFVRPLLEGSADLVMGSRFLGEILPGAMSWSHRWIGNPILSGMLRALFQTSVSDAHCGMRALTRHAYDRMRLRTLGMEFASEMVVAALREDLRIKEIPITYHPRVGESKLAGVRDAWRHVSFMLMFSPSYLFLWPAVLLMAVGGAIMVALAGGPVRLGGREWDYHAMFFGGAAVILGYNLLLFDALAKSFSMGAGFARPGKWLAALGERFSLERGLIAAAIPLAAGVAVAANVVFDWYRSGFGALMAVRSLTVGIVLLVLGIQSIFGAFLVSLLRIPRE